MGISCLEANDAGKKKGLPVGPHVPKRNGARFEGNEAGKPQEGANDFCLQYGVQYSIILYCTVISMY